MRPKTMTAKQYRKALAQLGLTIVGAGPYLGVAARQSQRYAQNDAPVPPLVARVLGLVQAGKITLADLDPKSPQL